MSVRFSSLGLQRVVAAVPRCCITTFYFAKQQKLVFSTVVTITTAVFQCLRVPCNDCCSCLTGSSSTLIINYSSHLSFSFRCNLEVVFVVL